jgi:hypothetical protein
MLASFTQPGAALEEFVALGKAIRPIGDAVSEAVYEFDEWVNVQVHDCSL